MSDTRLEWMITGILFTILMFYGIPEIVEHHTGTPHPEEVVVDTENVVISLLPIGRTSDGVVSHKLGTLRAGESKAIDVELTARQSGKIAIKAQAYADGGLRTEAGQPGLFHTLHAQQERPGNQAEGDEDRCRVAGQADEGGLADGSEGQGFAGLDSELPQVQPPVTLYLLLDVVLLTDGYAPR